MGFWLRVSIFLHYTVVAVLMILCGFFVFLIINRSIRSWFWTLHSIVLNRLLRMASRGSSMCQLLKFIILTRFVVNIRNAHITHLHLSICGECDVWECKLTCENESQYMYIQHCLQWNATWCPAHSSLHGLSVYCLTASVDVLLIIK